MRGVSDCRISVGLPTHPKTVKLIRRVERQGAWSLVCLFAFASANRPDGNLSGMSVEDIEIAADWQGTEGALVEALRDVGFLDGEDGELRLHDWAEHNPWAMGAERRSQAAREAALAKHRRGARKSIEIGSKKEASSAPDAHRMPAASAPLADAEKPQCPVSVSVSVSDSVSDTNSSSTLSSNLVATACSPRNLRASRLPEGWTLPDTWRMEAKRICAEKGIQLDIDDEAAKFADHWHAESGQRGRKVDWTGTWRNWIRRACEFAPRTANQTVPPGSAWAGGI